MDIGLFVGRCYDAFGCLFGVRNYANFNPVAETRGLPDNPSFTVKCDIRRFHDDWQPGDPLPESVGFHSTSYLTLEEIDEIDWDEEAEDADERVHVYRDGEYTGKFRDSSSLDDEDWQKLRRGEDVTKEMEHGHPVMDIPEEAEVTYRLEKITRRDALSGLWETLLFDVMPTLGDLYGEENVRLVVWFDN